MPAGCCPKDRTSAYARTAGKRWEIEKIPIYELAAIDKFCHNGFRGAIIVAKSVNRYISELLQKYQEYTKKTCTEMALDFNLTLSNLYQYRNGRGNPTAKTINKIINGVEENCPEAFRDTARW